MVDLNRFDLAAYGDILELLAGHQFLTFNDTQRALPEQFVLLRHDIDFSPDAALRMAEFEAARQVRATYFLLLSSPYYNLMDTAFVGFPRRLVELGHEVGLHYDIGTLEAASGLSSVAERFAFHLSVLGRLCGETIHSIAMHNPSLNSSALPGPLVDGLVDAYSPRYTTEIPYFSDSAGAWRKAAYDALSSGSIPAQLQLLIHPIFWAPSAGTRWDRLGVFFAERTERMAEREAYIKQAWTRHSGVIDHDARTR